MPIPKGKILAAAFSAILKKVIIFTGAMKPQKMIDSDAAFNVGCAIGAANVSPPGVYVCMNGRVFDCERVARDLTTGMWVDV